VSTDVKKIGKGVVVVTFGSHGEFFLIRGGETHDRCDVEAHKRRRRSDVLIQIWSVSWLTDGRED
jgi:hypothetical protein